MSKKRNPSVLEKIEDLYNSILDMLFPARVKERGLLLEKQRARAAVKKEAAEKAEIERKHVARVTGRGIFWNKRPYHPAMGENYRKILTAIGVDSRRTLRMYHPRCGTDMCTIAERNGPYVQYFIPPDDNHTEVVKNVAYNQLTNKVERVVDIITMFERAAYCHLFPIVNTPDMKFKEFCKNIYNKTVEDGYIVVSEFVPVEGREKIVDEFDFVFPFERTENIMEQQKFGVSFKQDHSDHWENILNDRLEEMRARVTLEDLPRDIDLLQGFNDELKRWILILKLIEKKQIRVMTRVYKKTQF